MDFSSSESIIRDKPNKPTIFIVEGRYQNWIKPIILLESLGAPYDTVVLDSAATSSEWFRNIHPQRMVPALVDAHREDRFNLWDSSSMLDYLGHRYDSSKEWVGKTWRENAEVSNWLTFETASLGPTAKYWVWYQMRTEDQKNTKAQEKMLNDLRVQYGILNTRLSKPGQQWLALKNRPTIADISVYPFADNPTIARMGLSLDDWPALKDWAERMAQLDGVRKAYADLNTWRAKAIK